MVQWGRVHQRWRVEVHVCFNVITRTPCHRPRHVILVRSHKSERAFEIAVQSMIRSQTFRFDFPRPTNKRRSCLETTLSLHHAKWFLQ